MYTNLVQHIQKHIELSDEDIKIIIACFKHQAVKKKALLLEEGHICNRQYFILKGCFRLYIINQKGSEQTLQFGIENWWMSDYISFETQKPSRFFIQAIENAEVVSIEKNVLDELLKKLPKLERYFRVVLQRAFGASQMRISYLFTMTAEERYHQFNTNFPEFVQRVPQYMLASYLDFTPEFMSKIRAGKI